MVEDRVAVPHQVTQNSHVTLQSHSQAHPPELQTSAHTQVDRGAETAHTAQLLTELSGAGKSRDQKVGS